VTAQNWLPARKENDMLDHIDTEKTNPATRHIDRLGTEDMLRLINREDQKVAEAVAQVLPQVA